MITFSFEAMQGVCEQVMRYPGLESGGALVGRGNDVLEVMPAANAAADDRSEFAIPAEQLAGIVSMAEATGSRLLGTYHSHPNGNARMSRADVALARHTGLLLIVAPGERWEWKLWDPAAAGEVQFAIAPPRS